MGSIFVGKTNSIEATKNKRQILRHSVTKFYKKNYNFRSKGKTTVHKSFLQYKINSLPWIFAPSVKRSKNRCEISQTDIFQGPVFASPSYGNTGCRVFKQEVQNWKDFCIKIYTHKGNYCILKIGLMGSCQKVPNFDFQSQFSMSKIIGIFLNFFSLKNINLGAHFLLLTFFDNINF